MGLTNATDVKLTTAEYLEASRKTILQGFEKALDSLIQGAASQNAKPAVLTADITLTLKGTDTTIRVKPEILFGDESVATPVQDPVAVEAPPTA